jgi:hypothetical protein
VLRYISRPQRIAILCTAMLTNMAFSAFFYGTKPGNTGHTFVAGFIGAAVMIPVSNVFPSVFAFTNTFRSVTIKAQPKRAAGAEPSAGGGGSGGGAAAAGAGGGTSPTSGRHLIPIQGTLVYSGLSVREDRRLAQLSIQLGLKDKDPVQDVTLDADAPPVATMEGVEQDAVQPWVLVARRKGAVVGRPLGGVQGATASKAADEVRPRTRTRSRTPIGTRAHAHARP